MNYWFTMVCNDLYKFGRFGRLFNDISKIVNVNRSVWMFFDDRFANDSIYKIHSLKEVSTKCCVWRTSS